MLRSTTSSAYHAALNALPPRNQTGSSFLLGEPYSDRVCSVNSNYTETWHGFFQCHRNAFYETVQPVTQGEFSQLRENVKASNGHGFPCDQDPENAKTVFLKFTPEKAFDISNSLMAAAGWLESEIRFTGSNSVPRRADLPEQVQTLDRLRDQFETMPEHSIAYMAGTFSPKECDAVVDGLAFMAAKFIAKPTGSDYSEMAVDVLKAQHSQYSFPEGYLSKHVLGLVQMEASSIEAHDLIRNQETGGKSQEESLVGLKAINDLRDSFKKTLNAHISKQLKSSADETLEGPGLAAGKSHSAAALQNLHKPNRICSTLSMS